MSSAKKPLLRNFQKGSESVLSAYMLPIAKKPSGLGLSLRIPWRFWITSYCDNQGTIALAKDNKFQARPKHTFGTISMISFQDRATYQQTTMRRISSQGACQGQVPTVIGTSRGLKLEALRTDREFEGLGTDSSISDRSFLFSMQIHRSVSASYDEGERAYYSRYLFSFLLSNCSPKL